MSNIAIISYRSYSLGIICCIYSILNNCIFLHQVSFSLINREGVETSGKVAIVTATSPYLLLLILLIRGLFLEGSTEGIYYLFKPDFVKLFSPTVWVDAAN